jgi:hypothetical protein
MAGVDYPSRDFGFSERPASTLTEALLEQGPLHGQIISIDTIEERKFDDGYYQKDPACTYASPGGKRYSLYRWRQNSTV